MKVFVYFVQTIPRCRWSDVDQTQYWTSPVWPPTSRMDAGQSWEAVRTQQPSVYSWMRCVTVSLDATSAITCCNWPRTNVPVSRLSSSTSIANLLVRLTLNHFLPREAHACVACHCYGMSSVRPSVSPSVTLVDCDHTHWDSRKVISPINSVILPLLKDPNIVRKFEG